MELVFPQPTFQLRLSLFENNIPVILYSILSTSETHPQDQQVFWFKFSSNEGWPCMADRCYVEMLLSERA